VNMLQKAR